MKPSHIAAIILVAALLSLTTIVRLLGDWFWFTAVGYESVFLTVLITSIIIGLIAFTVFFGFSYGNAVFAARTAARGRSMPKTRLTEVALIAGIAGFFAALSAAGSWETILKFVHQTSFSTPDPIFSLDVGFYLFSLPFYSLLVSFFLGLFIFATLLSALSFLLQAMKIRIREGRTPYFVVDAAEEFDWMGFLKQFLPHLNILLFLIFAALAERLWLARFDLLFSPSGAVFGAGYTDVNVTLTVLTILTFVAFAIGIGFLVNEKFKRVDIIKYGILAFMGIAIAGLIASGVMQALVVEPDESNLERPYLDYNIRNTLAAYGLDEARERIFPVNYSLTADDIRANNATVGNIRLWDWRPLKTTYEQLQLFRTYYTFNDVDVDRYMLDGMYKEVLISPREMDSRNLPVQAQTWVNRHLVYTHGYGAVMNPVDIVSAGGLPSFYLKDIPPTSDYIRLDEPRIYFGESTTDYAVIRTSTDELDYPAGERNIYTTYEGTGGVALSDVIRKFVYASRFGSIELLVSGSLEPDSRILLHRSIKDRVRTIAPFMSYDPDPYIVIADNRLFWILDAYVTSDRYPYSEPVQVQSISARPLNYIRNSVKVVIDAYNGDVTYYVVEPGDPLTRTYRKMFPELFRDFDEMPGELREHIRYPQGIFEIQAFLYATYHMNDPRVFYNREDQWVFPDEVYRGSRQPMEPYYIIMKLPGEQTEEFILMLPFTPRGKENMIGWMAARSDPTHYGELIVYQFSKQELTYGPMQIEARIDQDTEISQDITLWSQSGSSVLRGNTLIIPIENSIIYVEPLYLEATEKGTLPQLQRVIVAYNDRLTMQETLADALDVIFGEGAGTGTGEETTPPITAGDAEKLAKIAELYDRAQRALAGGDLGLYQRYIDEIGSVVSG
ncbi:MAG: hypothetical protein APR53_09795 [Methanoculleus sp. SDB]|nr:MAG: hypothetical protein APR53_09795 [Methanoculleus sp. SDB]